MGLKDLFYKDTTKKDGVTDVVPDLAPVEEESEPTPRLATGPLGRARSAAPARAALGGLRRSGLTKVNDEKLSNLRKRVFGSEPTSYTQILEQAKALEEAGIKDLTTQYRGAIKTTRVSKGDFTDSVSAHKTALSEQREAFARHVGGLRDKATGRQKEIGDEVVELERRFQELEAETQALDQQQQELEASEQEFGQVADALEVELVQTGDQIAALFTPTS